MNAPKQENLGLSLIDGVATSNFTDLSADVAESVLDTLTDAGALLEAVPVVGAAVKLIRAGISIHDRLFLRKLSRFLLQLQQVPLEERAAFVREIDQDPAFKKRMGEKLILMLDRVDELEKADVLGRLFRAYVVGRINYALFGRFSGLVDRAYLPDLQRLQRFTDDTPGDDEVVALEALGLVYQSTLNGGDFSGEAEQGYSITELGEKFANVLFS